MAPTRPPHPGDGNEIWGHRTQPWGRARVHRLRQSRGRGSRRGRLRPPAAVARDGTPRRSRGDADDTSVVDGGRRENRRENRRGEGRGRKCQGRRGKGKGGRRRRGTRCTARVRPTTKRQRQQAPSGSTWAVAGLWAEVCASAAPIGSSTPPRTTRASEWPRSLADLIEVKEGGPIGPADSVSRVANRNLDDWAGAAQCRHLVPKTECQ